MNRHTYILVTILAIFSLTTPAHANLLKKGFTVEYDVSYNSMDVGTNKRTLKFSDNTHAVFTSTAIPEGLAALILNETVTEQSTLEITANNIKPVNYSYKKNKKGNIEQYQIKFNWQKNEFYSTHEKKNFHLPTGSQDMISFMLHIMQALQNKKTQFKLPIAYKNRLRLFDVKQTGKETLELESGEHKTVKVEHYDKDKNVRFTLWCSPKLNYLPVKIVKAEADGDKVQFLLRKLIK